MKTLINIILFTVLVQTLTAAPVKSWTYAYNDTGAREQVVEDGELTDDTINIAGQVISRTGLPENSYAYDNDGNLESDPNWDYIFNEANQLIRMDNKEAVGYAVTFSYDFSGRRYEKSVLLEDVLTERTTYVYDGQRVIAEINTLEENVEDHELERTYTHGLYIDEVLAYTDHVDDLNSETFYVTTDRQFSVRSVVDSLGDVIEERNYDPFGKDLNGVAETSDLAYGFTGRRYDAESDLYYFRARYYSTELGQFISRDPLEYVDGMSVYGGYFSFFMNVDAMGLNSTIINHGVKLVETYSEGYDKYGEAYVINQDIQKDVRNSGDALGVADASEIYRATLETEICLCGEKKTSSNGKETTYFEKKFKLKDNKWDHVIIWGFALKWTNVRKQRTSGTPFNHEARHVAVFDDYYRKREKVFQVALSLGCVSRETAKLSKYFFEAYLEELQEGVYVSNDQIDLSDYTKKALEKKKIEATHSALNLQIAKGETMKRRNALWKHLSTALKSKVNSL